MFSGAVQNPDIKSLWPNILLWSKRADLSISMSYLLWVPGAEKKRKKKGICKTWMPIFFLVVMQFLRMQWWILLIRQLSFGVIEREKGKDYIILSRIAPWDKYLHLPCSACLFCCDSLIALVSHSPTTVAHLSPLSEPVEFASLSGVRDGDEGLEPLLVSAPFPLSLFSLFPLPQSSSFFSVLQYIVSVSPSPSLTHPLQIFLPPPPPCVFKPSCCPSTGGERCRIVPGGLIKVRSRSKRCLTHFDRKNLMSASQISG